ncbi:MAG: peptide chain release factor N(5)-glutamine methyltransferase [Bacteroidales bacterium]|nr:peptide chain release factor N(5)-glutamine methyltransferase [Bacteroidales bacterium]
MNTTNLRFKSNRFIDIEERLHSELDPTLTRPEVHSMVLLMCREWMGWSTADYLLHRREPVNQSVMLRFHHAMDGLKRHQPVQHIIGYVDFCGCRLKVGPEVLIPRPETAEMVEALGSLLGTDFKAGRILDLCTGSGCIAIALKRRWPEAKVMAVDISSQALAMARFNADYNGVDVQFEQCDILNTNAGKDWGRFDLIISNPPYVRQSEKAAMNRNVLDYEPVEALFVPDDDPLLFYRAIGSLVQRHLTSRGLLVLEINEALVTETSELLRGFGFETEVRMDFRGRCRVIVAKN